MQAFVYVMAILGCGEGDLPCDELRVANGRYPSQAECLEASADELRRQGDALYPVLVAQCRRSDEQATMISASDVSLPEPEQNRAYPVAR